MWYDYNKCITLHDLGRTSASSPRKRVDLKRIGAKEMAHRLDVEKTIQAVGVLLRKEGKKASRLRILKLLYVADRMSLEKTGSLMLGSKFVAMKHGPLHSEVLGLISGQHIAEATWSRHFRNVGRDIVLEGDEPDVGKLSRHEIQLLNEYPAKSSQQGTISRGIRISTKGSGGDPKQLTTYVV